MASHLREVKEFCEVGLKNGKLIPLNFSFPSFEISEDMYKEKALELVSDKVRLGLDYGSYKQETLSIVKKQVAAKVKTEDYGTRVKEIIENISYDDLLEAREAVENGTPNTLQKNQVIFADAMLAKQMNGDENLNYIEIGRKTILECCNDRLKDRLNELSMLQALDGLGDFNESRNGVAVEFTNKMNDLVATMLLTKDQLPSVYKQFNASISNMHNQSLVKELKELEVDPNILIIQKIAKFDNNFAQNNYPKQYRELKAMDNAAKSFQFA